MAHPERETGNLQLDLAHGTKEPGPEPENLCLTKDKQIRKTILTDMELKMKQTDIAAPLKTIF